MLVVVVVVVAVVVVSLGSSVAVRQDVVAAVVVGTTGSITGGGKKADTGMKEIVSQKRASESRTGMQSPSILLSVSLWGSRWSPRGGSVAVF